MAPVGKRAGGTSGASGGGRGLPSRRCDHNPQAASYAPEGPIFSQDASWRDSRPARSKFGCVPRAERRSLRPPEVVGTAMIRWQGDDGDKVPGQYSPVTPPPGGRIPLRSPWSSFSAAMARGCSCAASTGSTEPRFWASSPILQRASRAPATRLACRSRSSPAKGR